jgi:ankyrin repeat protein
MIHSKKYSMFTASHHGKECPCKKIPMCLSSFSAAEFGDIHSLALRLENRTSGTQQDSAGNSPLHLAAQHGQVAAVAYLLRRFDVNVANGGSTPLHRASFSGATATMRLLLDDPTCDLLVQDTSFGDAATPLHKACAGGRYLAVQLLLEALSSRGLVAIAMTTTNAAGETPRQVVRRIIQQQHTAIEEERASVARWNSVSGHQADWERCEAVREVFPPL